MGRFNPLLLNFLTLNENLGIFFYKGESNFEKNVNIITCMRPNPLKVNVVDSSDRFEHVVNPKCT